jgi:hypothetical protein
MWWRRGCLTRWGNDRLAGLWEQSTRTTRTFKKSLRLHSLMARYQCFRSSRGERNHLDISTTELMLENWTATKTTELEQTYSYVKNRNTWLHSVEIM